MTLPTRLAATLLALCLGPFCGTSLALVQDASGGSDGAPSQQEASPDPSAQEPPPGISTLAEPGTEELTPESLQIDKEAIQANSLLSDAARDAALAELQLANDALTRAAASKATTAQYLADVAAAPDRVAQIQQDLATPLEQTLPVRRPGSDLAEVQDQRDAAASALAEAQGARDRLQATSTRRSERRIALDVELLDARAKLDGLLSALENPSTAEQDPTVRDAQRKRLLAEIQEARVLLIRLDAEQDRNQAEEQLVSLRLDLARRHVRAAEEIQEAWDQILRDGRRQDAEEAVNRAAQTRTTLARKYAGLRQVIESIDELSAELMGTNSVIALMDAASEERSLIAKEYLRVRASYADTIHRFQVAGATRALGFVLRLEYAKLDDPDRLRIDSKRRQRAASEALYRVLVLDELRGDVGDIGERVQRLVETAEAKDPFATDEDKQAFVQAATELCTNERDLASSLRRNNVEYAEILQRTEATAAQLIELSDLYERFIRQHILWQRSVDRPFHLNLPIVLAGLEWAIAGDEGDLESLGSVLSQRRYGVLLYGLVLVVLFIVRRRARARLSDIAPLVGSYKTDSLKYTRSALLQTVLASLPWPAMVYGAGLLIEVTGNTTESEWQSSWWHTLRLLASYLLPLCLGLEILRRNGLARAHLRWPEESCRRLSVLMIEFLVPLWLLGLLQLPFQVWGETPYRDTTGRLIFIVSMIVLSVFCFRMLLPRGPVLGAYYSRHPDSFLTRLRGSLSVVGVGLAASTALLALFGYFFTARMVARGLLGTLMLSFGVALMVGLANRWQVFHRRRLALTKALERRAEREASGGDAEPPDVSDDIDISTLDSKTRQLISNAAIGVLLLGLLTIWSDSLPALQVLQRVQLLPTLEVTPEHVTNSEWLVPGLTSMPGQLGGPPEATGVSTSVPAQAEGTPPNSSVTPMRMPIPMPESASGEADASSTAAQESATAYRLDALDVLTGLLVLILTVIAVRNGPALLELGVLTRLNIDAGARYAVTTLIRYGLIIFGVTVAFGAVGVGWASVQWLAAAMTFGLAFGLQEIFANFISGLILLVERPIRLGDTVTIGDLTGTVGRIRPRATTILDFDNRERLIPNKMLITDEVINWTLSSAVTRLVTTVGVAYGTNTHLVFKNLMRAATESPCTMADPAPSVLFKGFGESSLDFDLRYYIEDREVWVDAVNDINIRVADLFEAAGIVIAFPQRDLHIRSTDVPFSKDQD